IQTSIRLAVATLRRNSSHDPTHTSLEFTLPAKKPRRQKRHQHANEWAQDCKQNSDVGGRWAMRFDVHVPFSRLSPATFKENFEKRELLRHKLLAEFVRSVAQPLPQFRRPAPDECSPLAPTLYRTSPRGSSDNCFQGYRRRRS